MHSYCASGIYQGNEEFVTKSEMKLKKTSMFYGYIPRTLIHPASLDLSSGIENEWTTGRKV